MFVPENFAKILTFKDSRTTTENVHVYMRNRNSLLTEQNMRNMTPQYAYICLHLHSCPVMKKQMLLSKERLCHQLTVATERLSAFTFNTQGLWVKNLFQVTHASQTPYSITTARAVIEGMGKSTGKSSQPSSSCPLEATQTMFRHTVNNSCPCLS